MDEAKEFLQLDWKTIIIGIVVIAAFLKIAVEFIGWIVNQFGIEFKHVRKRNEEHDLLMKTIGRMDEFEVEQKNMREEVRSNDRTLIENYEKLSNSMEILSKKFDDMLSKQDATERASLKDRIAQQYRKYAVEKQWTKMEKESFDGLIRDYEARGGSNSFVHTVCEPESYTWVVTDGEKE